ncbi:MAG: hypothetical protein JJU10_03130 [Idiomarina sp.]|nr:hypothetical protein [Idiomarina sp.]
MQETRLEAIDIGMGCSPEWLCQGMLYVIGLTVLAFLIYLGINIALEVRRSNARKRKFRDHVKKREERKRR